HLRPVAVTDLAAWAQDNWNRSPERDDERTERVERVPHSAGLDEKRGPAATGEDTGGDPERLFLSCRTDELEVAVILRESDNRRENRVGHVDEHPGTCAT